MRALSIASKDTRHVYRNIAGLVMMLVAPMLLAFALGAAFGGSDNYSISAVKTAVVNQDAGTEADTAAGAMLASALTSPRVADLLQVTQVDTPDEAKTLVDAGDADVAVLIPAGLTAALFSTKSGSQTATVEIYKDPTLTVGPAIVEAVVQSAVGSLNGARASAVTVVQLGLEQGLNTSRLSVLASQAAQAYSTSAASGEISIEQRAPELTGVENQEQPNVASQVLVGMMLFFMLFGASIPARSILDEHREGTLSRLFTTPTPRSTILAGKYIAVFLVVLVQAVVLVVAGRFLLGARWGEIGPLAVLIISSSLVAASLGLVTVSFAKTPAQAGAVSAAIFVFLGLISGNFTGGVNIGGAYAVVRHVSPLGWLMEGWTDLLFGGSWGSIGLPVVVALAFALVFFGIATFFFRRRYA